MFVELAQMAKAGPVTIIVTGDEKSLQVTVCPKGAGPLATPISLTGSPAELDAEIAHCLLRFQGARKSLQEQMDATTAVLEEAKKASAGDAAKALSKAASKPSKAAVMADEEGDGEGDDGGCCEAAPAVGNTSAATPSDNPFL